ncbi:Rrf2 family transcriptional regulator [Proteus mirabilis]|nr:Rrf2 family transcriptional regulator [Proteus mirabilis]
MKVIIENTGSVIWYRDDSKKEGMASRGYIKDGMQKKIITALESALVQAKAELQLSQDVD